MIDPRISALLAQMEQQVKVLESQARRSGGKQPHMEATPGDIEMLLQLVRENIVIGQQLKLLRLDNARLGAQVAQLEGMRDDDCTNDAASGGSGGSSGQKSSRYWSDQEHQLFLEAVSCFGFKDVKAISLYVGTRNPTQVRTHAQKYMLKLQKQTGSDQCPEGQDLPYLAQVLADPTPEQLQYELYTRSGGNFGIPPPAMGNYAEDSD